jgi:hypothetical protein
MTPIFFFGMREKNKNLLLDQNEPNKTTTIKGMPKK